MRFEHIIKEVSPDGRPYNVYNHDELLILVVYENGDTYSCHGTADEIFQEILRRKLI